ncbi:MAG: division/cell wall cluster transcriptional repressor MraZ [Proteobacteria bacterium]|jgi:MraZ protein|nr:division/cell wall cluster transcriptional repressor MraZ [Pseudomonadota bacterium]
MFGGVTHLNLDLKNRIAVPAKYREELLTKFGNRVTLTLESPKYLLIYPENNWTIVRDKIQNLETSSHPLVKSYQRLVLGYAETMEVDKSGRILLPSALKNLVKLDKEVVLVGLGNRFELWGKENWEAETKNALDAKADDLASLLNGFSL